MAPRKKATRLSRKRPSLVVLAGPNGAGKTTSAAKLVPQFLKIEHFVNADFIAQGLSPFSPAAAAIQAGRILLQRIHALADRFESFAFETTLASKTFVPFLKRQRQRGYLIHLVFIWLESADLAVQRVSARVQSGGHTVPTEDVIRRYRRGLENFFRIYMPLADTWTIWDNSTSTIQLIARGRGTSRVTVFEPRIFEKIKKASSYEGKD